MVPSLDALRPHLLQHCQLRPLATHGLNSSSIDSTVHCHWGSFLCTYIRRCHVTVFTNCLLCFIIRILVLKDLVGAIIGRGGNTIKQITQETHARVDVHRKESSTANENVIMIYGNPENCSQACRRILEVMQQEARSLNRPEDFVLKILASNNLIGRIIGKGGSTIKRVMQQTETKITVSRWD